MILIIIKFCELLLRISPRIINSLRSYIKQSKECFLLFPNTSKLVKKTRLRLVFPTYFSVYGNRRKHSSSCLIYYFSFSDFQTKMVEIIPYFRPKRFKNHTLWRRTYLIVIIFLTDGQDAQDIVVNDMFPLYSTRD